MYGPAAKRDEMARPRFPMTPAVRWLRSKQVEFKPHLYRTTGHGGARQAAKELKVCAHRVIKTLVMENQDQACLLMLMHGDRAVSTQRMARLIGSKRVFPVQPEKALQVTGYRVGGISPFGTRKDLPIYAQETILELETIFINGGKRGFLVEIAPGILVEALRIVTVDASIAGV